MALLIVAVAFIEGCFLIVDTECVIVLKTIGFALLLAKAVIAARRCIAQMKYCRYFDCGVGFYGCAH